MSPSDATPLLAGMLAMQGPDAAAFAHAQFTSDVRALEVGTWQWSAWLDARGRVQNFFHLARLAEDDFVLVLRGGDAAAMAERLKRFVFRAKLTLSPGPAAHPVAGESLPAFVVHRTDAAFELGLGTRRLQVLPTAEDALAWRLEAIRHGEPWLPDAFLDSLLPPALGLRRLGALSLDKGCFPGQEIAARLHYHGGHKHALAHLRLDAAARPGDAVLSAADDDGPIKAQVLDSVPSDRGHEVLAVLHESALDTPVDGVTLVHRFAP